MRVILLCVLCVLQSTALGVVMAQKLDDGYQLRVDHSKSGGRYLIVLEYPDGKEELIWNPPATQSLNFKQSEVFLGDVCYAKIAAQKLSVVISEGNNWWWLRWDMTKKYQFPLVKFPGQRRGMAGFDILDGQSLSVVYREKSDIRITLIADENGVLREDGKPWNGAYSVFIGNREIVHLQPSLGGETVYHDTPAGFPFIDTGRPAMPPYTIDVDGTRRPYSLKLGPTDFEGAKRVWPPRNDGNPAATAASDNANKSRSVASMPNGNTRAFSPLFWGLLVGIGAALYGVAGWLRIRSQRQK